MGFKGGAIGCFNRPQGKGFDSKGDYTGSDTSGDGGGGGGSCSVCGCPSSESDNGGPSGGTSCKRWSYETDWLGTQKAVEDAISKAASDAGVGSYTEKIVDRSGNTVAAGQKASPGSCTMVTADTFQDGFDVYGVNTVGGRQILRIQNGALDLRWHLNQGFDSYTFEQINDGPTVKFNPGGFSGVMGFLHWIKPMPNWDASIYFQYLSGAGGLTREQVGLNDSPADTGDPYEYDTKGELWSRRNTQTGEQIWYVPNQLDPSKPAYGIIRKDGTGNAIYYDFDAFGDQKLDRIYGDIGRLAPYFYYDAGNRIKVIALRDREGVDDRAIYFKYNAGGTLSKLVEPEGVVTYFQLLPSNLGSPTIYFVHKEVDPEGNVTYLEYDSGNNDRLISINQSGRVVEFQDNGERSGIPGTSAAVWPDGSARRFHRDDYSNHSFAVTNQALGGSSTQFQYNNTGNQVSSRIDPNGNETQFQINDTHFRTRTTRADGGIMRFAYKANNRDLSRKTGPRHSATFPQATYYRYLDTTSGQRTRILDALGHAVYFRYDNRKRQTRSLDARGGATYFGYDKYSQIHRVRDASGHTAYYRYNANAKRTRVFDSLGRTTYFNFDKLDQLRSKLSPDSERTTYGLDKLGRTIRTGMPGGRAAYYRYDAFSNTKKTARLLGGQNFSATYFGYDVRDNQTRERDPNGNLTYYGYDGRQLRFRTLDALGNSTYFVFDPSGNLTDTVDAKRRYTRTEYNSVNQQKKNLRGVVGLRPPQRSDLQAHFTLNEAQGATRVDDSGSHSANDLADSDPGNEVGSVAGYIGNSAQFTGNQYLKTASGTTDTLNITGSISLAAWIKPSALPTSGGGAAITDKSATGALSYQLLLRHDVSADAVFLEFRISTDGTTWAHTITAEVDPITTQYWRHVVGTFNAGTGEFRIYVDGFLVRSESSAVSSIHNPTTSPFRVGSNLYEGLIDEVYVYNSVLSQKSISRLAQQRLEVTFAPESTNLIATYFKYDLDSNQTASVDPKGRASYFAFDALNRSTKSLDPLKNATYFRLDANGNQTRTRNPRGFATYFGFDILNRQTKQLDALGRATYFRFDAVSNRTRTRYADLSTQYFGFDGDDRQVRSVDQGGFTTYYHFDGVGNRTRVLDARRKATYFRFDRLDRQTAIKDALLNVTYFRFDLNGNQTRRQDPQYGYGEGPWGLMPYGSQVKSTYFGYDALNRQVRQLDPLLRSTYFRYDSVGNQTRVDLPGTPRRVTYFGFDKFDRLTRSLSPTRDASYFGYDPASNRTRTRNPRGFATYFGFDALNRQSRSLDAKGGAAYFGFDANSNLVRQRDRRGFATYFVFDALDRLKSTTDALLNKTVRGYDLVDNLHAVLPARGGAVYFGYDARRLLTRTVDGAGDKAYFRYDANANRTRTLSPRGFGTYFRYDALNRLDAVLDAMSGTAYFTYNKTGSTVLVRDALSRPTYFGYDVLDRLGTVLNTVGDANDFFYDRAGNRKAERDGRGYFTYYRYDVGDRLHAVRDPLGKAAYYGYDANSNLARTLDNNLAAVYFAYDGLDRRTRINYTSQVQTFGYDSESNLRRTLDDWGAAYFAFDPLSRMNRRITPNLDAVYYGYDAVSNLVRLKYPRDGAASYYAFDNAQRLSRLRSTTLNPVYYVYDASSNVVRKDLGNGIVSWASFDKTDRMTRLRYARSNGTGIVYFDYGRDVAGRIMRIAREANLNIYYQFDGIDRLTSETWRKRSNHNQIYAFSYSYDSANNRKRMRRETAGVEVESAYYWYNAANELTDRVAYPGPISTYYFYDSNGALLREWAGGSTTYYAYGENRLIRSITPPSGSPWRFWYDARLSRYCIDKGGTFAYYNWDGLRNLEERSASGALVARFTHGRSRLPGIGTVVEVERNAGGGTYYQYPLMDHRGTAYVIADAAENAQIQYVLDSFGRELAAPSGLNPSVPNELISQANWLTIKVGGRWYGLSKFRINMPELGIFLSRDFLNYPNKYRAWSNNPVGQVDNNGLEDEKKKKDEKEFPAPKAPTDQKGVQEEFVLDGNGQVVIAINSSKVSPDTPSYDKNKSLKQISDELNDVTRNLPPHYYEDNNSDIYRNRLYASAYQWNLNVQKLITFVEGKENRPWLLNGKASSKEEILKALRALIIWKVVILSANQQDAKDALRNLRNAIVDGGTLIFETHSDNLRVDIGTAEGLQTTPTRTDLGKILKGEKKINFILAGCSSTQENIDIIAKQATNVTVSGEVKYQHTLFPDQPGRKTPQTQEEYNKGEDIEITNFGLPIVGQP